ncbi:MAG: hypothetical protein AAF732_02530 [Pseudomonadota bacterium]
MSDSSSESASTLIELLATAYFLPLRRAADLVRVFWPALICLISAVLAHETIPSAVFGTRSADHVLRMRLLVENPVMAPLIAIPFLLVIYAVFLFASGLVAWQRMLVLGEPPQRAHFWPNTRASDLALKWFLLFMAVWFAGLASMIVFLLVLLVVASIIIRVLASELPGAQFINPDVALTNIPGHAALVFTMSLGGLLVCWFRARWTLLLPITAVEDTRHRNTVLFNWNGPVGHRYGAAIFCTVWPMTILPQLIIMAVAVMADVEQLFFVLPGTEPQTLTEMDAGLLRAIAYVVDVMTVTLAIYAVLGFSTLSAVYYRDRVRTLIMRGPLSSPRYTASAP